MQDLGLQRFHYLIDSLVKAVQEFDDIETPRGMPYCLQSNVTISGQRELARIINDVCRITEDPALHSLDPPRAYLGDVMLAECVHDEKAEMYNLFIATGGPELTGMCITPKNVWAYLPDKERAALVIQSRAPLNGLYSLSMPSSVIANDPSERMKMALRVMIQAKQY